MKTNIISRLTATLASIFCMTTVVLAQSISSPWAATIKASYNKSDDIATYIFKFTNVSGKASTEAPILGYRCSYFNLPVMVRTAPYLDQPFWSANNKTEAERGKYNCEAVFGNTIGIYLGEKQIASPYPFGVFTFTGAESESDSGYLDPKSYKTSNGWLVESNQLCGEGTCGTSLYELKLWPGSADEAKFISVPAGQSFEFSVNLWHKDPNYLRTNYLVYNSISGKSGQDDGTWAYRAYPITKADTTPPVITAALTLTPPKPNDNINSVRVQLAASAKDNFDAGPEWSVSSVLRADKPTVAGDVTRTVDMVENQWLLKVPTGETRTYTVNIRAEDATGNVTTKAIPITIKGATLPPPKTVTQCTFFGLFCSPVIVK